LLDLAGGRISYVKLLKMLYLADKQMLIERGYPITYDRWYAMQYGPILSATYNRIRGKTVSTYWSEYIDTDTDKFDVVLKGDPGSDDLSRAEDRIIDAVFEKYKNHKPSDETPKVLCYRLGPHERLLQRAARVASVDEIDYFDETSMWVSDHELEVVSLDEYPATVIDYDLANVRCCPRSAGLTP
jgi:hypothetical protein